MTEQDISLNNSILKHLTSSCPLADFFVAATINLLDLYEDRNYKPSLC